MIAKWLTLVCGLLLGMAWTGCGGSDTGPGDDSSQPNANNSTAEPEGFSPVAIAGDDLPIGDYLPPLDEGRVELADPKGWKRFPRSKDYVARFFYTNSKSLPRIIVTSADSPYDGITEATSDNHEALLKAVVAEVGDKGSLLETPLAVTIGDRPYIRYVLSARLGPEGAERQVLVTVLGGRKYEVDLQIKKRTIQEFKTAGYAVAASLRKAESSLPQTPVPPAAPAADDSEPKKP